MRRQLAITMSLLALLAASSTAQTRPPAAWVEIIEAEAADPTTLPDAEWEKVRLVTGWSLPSLSGKRWGKGEIAEAAGAFLRFVDSRGYGILNRALQGKQLARTEEPYRRLMLALYLRAAVDKNPRKPAKDRWFLLDMKRVHGSLDDCFAYRDGVMTKGQAAVRKGIVEQKLSAEDVEAIRMYRIAAGMRGVGECFLPFHYGLHPYLTEEANRRPSGHGRSDVKEANLGKPYHDFLLPKLEHVLESRRYTDVVDYSYHYTFSLRPEGVLEFLRPMTWYTRTFGVRPERLELKSGQQASDFVRLKDLVGEKPVLLYINDPVDGPVTEMFERFEVLYQAYRNRMHILFVAVNIHDWHYSGMREFFTGPSASRRGVGHSWCVEERARKLKNRYLESPHASFPAVIDNNGQIVKNLYGTAGGANHFVIIDRKGVIAEYVENQHGGLNEVEAAIRRTLGNDGLQAEGAKVVERYRRSQVPGLEPVRHRIRLQPGTVTKTDLTDGTILVTVSAESGKLAYELNPAPMTRLTREGRPIKPADLKVGQTILVEGFLDRMMDGAKPALSYQDLKRQTVAARGREMALEPLGGYGRLRRIWYVMADSKPTPFVPRSVEVVPPGRQPLMRWPDAVSIWTCGRVKACDILRRSLSIEMTYDPARDRRGYRFWLEAREANQKLYPSDTVTQRMAVVAGWDKSGSRLLDLCGDDAVDVILNGRFGASWKDVRVGDFVGVQYDARQVGGPSILPQTLRVTR